MEVEHAKAVKEILSFYGSRRGLEPETETVCVFDDTSHNYLLIFLSWDDGVRVSQTMVHIRIKNGKIIFEHDMTDLEIDRQLLEAGIPFADLVLHEEAPNAR